MYIYMSTGTHAHIYININVMPHTKTKHTHLRRLMADPLAGPDQRGGRAFPDARGGGAGLAEEGEALGWDRCRYCG